MRVKEFQRDPRCFASFLPTPNGIFLYGHTPFDVTLNLNACLTGLGGVVANTFIICQFIGVIVTGP